MRKLIIWSEGYSVNNSEIDEQHKKLINLINQLYNIFLDKNTDQIADILKEIQAYTLYHFNTEEKLFSKYKYPNRLDHIKMHESFIEEFKKLSQTIDTSSDIFVMKIITFLQKWLTNHIMKEDKKYQGYL